MSKRVRDRSTPVYRCPCCAQVLELVEGSLRRVPTDVRCRACGHNRGSHLLGFRCVGGGGDGVIGLPGPCSCQFFHEDPALVARATLGQEGGT